LTKFLIGAGGWAYFQVPGQDSLAAYSKAFNFVEVNSTFYKMPNFGEVESWRRRVPKDFEFTVRCHRSLTHKLKLEPLDESYEILSEMIAICKTLDSNILHLQTPSRLKLTDSKIQSVCNFFKSANLKGLRIAWEVRQTTTQPLPPNLVKLMQDFNIVHCVDLSREEPAYPSDVLYARLFGKGKHNIYQFTDEELKEIDKKATRGEHKRVIASFHGLRMYKDAARFKIYKEKGSFPMVTKSIGLSSLKEVLSEDAKFPATKQELIEHQGWKVIDLTRAKRIHAAKVLQKLPDQTYHDTEEIIQTLKQTTPTM